MNHSAAAKYDDDSFTLQMLREQRYAKLGECCELDEYKRGAARMACHAALARHPNLPVPAVHVQNIRTSALLLGAFSTSAGYMLEQYNRMYGPWTAQSDARRRADEEQTWRSYFGPRAPAYLPIPSRPDSMIDAANFFSSSVFDRIVVSDDYSGLVELRDERRALSAASQRTARRENRHKEEVRQKHQRPSKSARNAANRNARAAHTMRKK